MVTAARNNLDGSAENERASDKDCAFFVPTSDGSLTLRSVQFNQTYHSVGGAVQESEHVYLHHGLQHYIALQNAILPEGTFQGPVHLLEMGFGTGLNAWLTFLFANNNGCRVVYETVELYPLDEEVWSQLHYGPAETFDVLHRAPWETPVVLSPYFTLIKRKADISTFKPISAPYNVVYYDAFSPDAQPVLWCQETFMRIAGFMAADGVLTTYSSKGTVKQALRESGFTVCRLSGVGGKRHIVRASLSMTGVIKASIAK